MSRYRRHALPWIGLVAALALVRGAFLAVLVPPFQTPDEPAHFDYAQRLVEVGRLADPGTPGGAVEGTTAGCEDLSPETEALRAFMRPSFFHREVPVPPVEALRLPPDAPEGRMTRLCSPAAAYSPAYYLLAALAYRTDHRAPLLSRLLAARWASVLLGVAGAMAAFLAGLWLLGDVPSAVCLGLAYALQPMQSLLFSSVNNDALLFTATTAAFAATAYRFRDPSSRVALVAVAVAGLVAGAAKPTFALAAPALLVAVATASGPARVVSWVVGTLTVVPGLAAVLGWRRWMEGAAVPTAFTEPAPDGAVSAASGAARALPSPGSLEALWGKFYWMNWGWHDLRLPTAYYRWMEVLLVMALLGCTVGWRRLARAERGLVLVAAAGSILMVGALHFLDAGYRIGHENSFLQGRYLLPLFVLQAAAIMVGLRGAARRISVRQDAAFALPLTLAAMLGASALHAVARYHA